MWKILVNFIEIEGKICEGFREHSFAEISGKIWTSLKKKTVES